MPVSANEPPRPNQGNPPQPGAHLGVGPGPARQNGTFSIELDREVDGRWIAEVLELPGVLAYGDSRQQAVIHAKALALRVLADQLEHGEATDPLDTVFSVVP